MRMADLSLASGLPVATIKFYLREGLLMPGRYTSPNQARYDDAHLRRLRLVRSMIEVGGLTVAQTRDVLAASDEGPLMGLAAAQCAMAGEPATVTDPWVEERFQEVLSALGWTIHESSPAAKRVREVIASARDTAGLDVVRAWPHYAEHADQIARADVVWTAERPDPQSTVSAAVVGTVLGSAYLSALRMLAHQHHSQAAWPGADAP